MDNGGQGLKYGDDDDDNYDDYGKEHGTDDDHVRGEGLQC